MASIGERAAQAIRERAAQNDTSLRRELDKVNVSRKVLSGWEHKGLNPSAYYIQQLLLAGYDIEWILVGGRENG